MKIAVIDIGSNSVRLMMWADGKTLCKKIVTTRLGEGLSKSPNLTDEAIERTVKGVNDFVVESKEAGAERIYAFATAAVRSAQNGYKFTEAVLKKCGIEVDIVSGEQEASMGFAGALGSNDGGIIDVGGASTEVTVRMGGKVIYARSVNIGTVRILDTAGRDLNRINKFVLSKMDEYGDYDFSKVNFLGVGGTASRLGAIKNNITTYNSEIINGTCLTAEEIHAMAKRLTTLSVDEIKQTTICGKSADLIGGGAELLACVMDKFKISKLSVSESDNLEGYLKYKCLSD
ncbi:MAG: hypothetical protein ACI4MS_03070 [Candidatus Coproplasma sp.]